MAAKGYEFPHSTPSPPTGPENDASETGVKATKVEANYRPAGSSDTNCGSCQHYQGTGVCAVVAGLVDTSHVSDFWKKRKGSIADLIP